MKKFSIVITTYNRLDFLQRSVESALQQSQPCEVIVVDDCSADGTADYLEGLGNRIIYHRNPTNLGHCQSVNQGVALAQGEWIKLIDDDDYLAFDCIEKMTNAIAAYPHAVIASCQAIQVNEKGMELSQTRSVGTESIFYVPQEDIHYGMLLEMLPFGTPVQVAFQKRAFLKAKGWDIAFNGNYDDIDAWVRISQYGDAVFVNEVLAYRTLWSGNTIGKLSLQEKLEKHLAIKQQIYDLVSDKYRSCIPKTTDVRAFLELYWGLVGLKNGQFLTSFKILYPSFSSPTAFSRLAQLLFERNIKSHLHKLNTKAIFPNHSYSCLESLDGNFAYWLAAK